MGIPSYFKKLIQTKKTLLLRNVPVKVDALAIDFNCIVYTCLRSSELSEYPGLENEENHRRWEGELLGQVCKTLKEIWESAGSPPRTFVAVDGVVPMAKIRQQRMRRFKSVWWAEKEYEMGVRKRGVPRWDTNAITPGTQFMDSLTTKVGTYCAQHKWEFSSANEKGEGEHKLIRWLRENPSLRNNTIFGLDADLILLSMLYSQQKKTNVWLMREKSEFQDAGADVKYMFLDVCSLREALVSDEHLLDYIMGMSLLGNDFLPHGLTFKIRENGHEQLLRELNSLHAQGIRLVENETLNLPGLKALLSRLASTEEEDMKRAIKKKLVMKPSAPRNDTEKQMLPIQGLPLEWNAEKIFGTPEKLVDGWKDIYRKQTPKEACASYLFGLQWILDYYLGKQVVTSWYFHWNLPPLWSDLVENLDKQYIPPANIEIVPQEQLAMVLPMESWHLVRNPTLQRLPTLLPQFWPTRFGFLSLGRAWMWECEADIPILTPGRLQREIDCNAK
jgi:5'-3' exonuclease